MTEKAQQIVAMALELEPGERSQVVSELLASLDRYSELHPAWAEEVAQRVDQLDSGRVAAIPWTLARARILDRKAR